MSGRVIQSNGKIRRASVGALPGLDVRDVTDEVVRDPKRLLDLLRKLFQICLSLVDDRRPDFIDYEDYSVAGTTGTPQQYRFAHQFGARVRWYAVDWVSGSATGPLLRKHADTTADVLVLESMAVGILTLRVEAMP